MSNELHAAYYADSAKEHEVAVVENVRIAQDTYRVRFHCPEMAKLFVPGQFLMLRLADYDDPLLGRPLALYDTVLDKEGRPCGVDIVYLVLGKMTSRLAKFQPGQQLGVWGPLGNGFPSIATDHLIMVAGGIGQTPFLALGREYLGKRQYGTPPRSVPTADRVTICYGARSRDLLAGVDDFEAAGFDVRISTDDGTAGHHGLVTDLLKQTLADSGGNAHIVCCGPEPMMEAVSGIAAEQNVGCHISLETPMACGIGICFSCVAKIRQPDGEWDYKRTCVEGPVFEATKVVW